MVRASSWNRSRATAVFATLLLHLELGSWLLQAWFVQRGEEVREDRQVWLPAPEPPPLPPPRVIDLPPVRSAPITAPPLPILPPARLRPPGARNGARRHATSPGA